jgi:para-aminobenzoate synthetase component I
MKTSTAPFVLFQDDIAERAVLFSGPLETVVARTHDELLAAFERLEMASREGLWSAGFVSYEAGYHLEPALMQLAKAAMPTPLLCFGLFDQPLRERSPAASTSGNRAEELLGGFQAQWDFGRYARSFHLLHDHLRKGDCYQANLTFPVRGRWQGSALDVFTALVANQPVRYGACVTLCDPHVVSRSPELFFSLDRDGWIEAHPMKGTAARGTDADSDAREIDKLRHDEKSLAENVMIVDLLRNDISRICKTGTLTVPSLFEVETYPTLHQMISRIRGRVPRGTTIFQIFSALFPCGSITGAPKISAMRILDRLEGSPREAYCGAIGYIAPGGEMLFNVAIRTLSLFESGEAVFNVGGGIVFDSTVRAEYEEALLKTRFATEEVWDSR